jgi:hypothetical protein
MGSELRYIVCPFLKKIIFSHIILITFLFKFDQFTIVSSFFFCLIKINLAYSI